MFIWYTHCGELIKMIEWVDQAAIDYILLFSNKKEMILLCCCVSSFIRYCYIITWDFCPSSYMGISCRFNNLTCPWTVVIPLIQNSSVTFGVLSIPNKFVKKSFSNKLFLAWTQWQLQKWRHMLPFPRWRHKHCQAKGNLLFSKCISAHKS